MNQGRNYGLGEKFWVGGEILGRGQNFGLSQKFKVNKKLANFFKTFGKKVGKQLKKSWQKLIKK